MGEGLHRPVTYNTLRLEAGMKGTPKRWCRVSEVSLHAHLRNQEEQTHPWSPPRLVAQPVPKSKRLSRRIRRYCSMTEFPSEVGDMDVAKDGIFDPPFDSLLFC